MKTAPLQRTELGMEELESILQRARTSPLDEQDCAKIRAVFETYLYLTDLLGNKATTIDRLRKLLFGPSSEKTRDVLPPPGPAPAASTSDAPPAAEPERTEPVPSKRPGHGRNGAEAYEGAVKIPVAHESLKSGDPCPECKKGKVYEVAQPGVLVRITGQAPVRATVYELQKLRCNLCGKVFTAPAPEGIGAEKYDATSASMIALLKYGSGRVQGKAVSEMREGLSWSGGRTRPQTSPTCGGQEPSWGASGAKGATLIALGAVCEVERK